MSQLKRITATLTAQFNSFIDEIENHEAVAESVIRNLKVKIGDAKFHHKRLERDLDLLMKKSRDREIECERWKNRALKFEAEDHTKALDCMRRLEVSEKEKTILQHQHEELQAMTLKLGQDIKTMESKFDDLIRRKNVLASREARADAMKSISDGSALGRNDLEGVFERWERNVIHSEVTYDVSQDEEDHFEKEIEAEENQVSLEMRLNELLASDSKRTNKA
jgi:phage shock protein A